MAKSISKTKSKLRLSDNLKLGVAAPTSQSAFFKYGGVVFLVLSLILAVNIFRTLKQNAGSSGAVLTSAQLQQQVLGAYDQPGANSSGTGNGAPKIGSYKVQSGDTVFVIAQTLHIDWQVLATLNNLKPPYFLKIGQTLKVPAAQN